MTDTPSLPFSCSMKALAPLLLSWGTNPTCSGFGRSFLSGMWPLVFSVKLCLTPLWSTTPKWWRRLYMADAFSSSPWCWRSPCAPGWWGGENLRSKGWEQDPVGLVSHYMAFLNKRRTLCWVMFSNYNINILQIKTAMSVVSMQPWYHVLCVLMLQISEALWLVSLVVLVFTGIDELMVICLWSTAAHLQ